MSQDLDQQVRQAVADFCRQAPRRYPVVSIALVVILGIGLALFLIWQVPHWQVPKAGLSTKDWLQQINENRKTMAQIVGGIFILWGLYIAWVRSKAMRDQAEVDREQQLTDLYVKAIEQLGNEKLQIRLGGIYALERIARESAKDHWPIMEVLTAFVRENAFRRPDSIGGPEPGEDDVPSPPPSNPTTDIQAVLTVLGRTAIDYAQEGETRSLDLQATHLAGADLRQANLQRANLQECNLKKASLKDANLKEGHLEVANLQKAHLMDANLYKANLWRANLQGVVLGGANLQEALILDANLQGADFGRANIQKAHLAGTKLQGADLRMAKALTPEQAASAIWDETTKWPEGFSPPPSRTKKDEERIIKANGQY